MTGWPSKMIKKLTTSKITKTLTTLLIKIKTLQVKTAGRHSKLRNGTVANYARSALDMCRGVAPGAKPSEENIGRPMYSIAPRVVSLVQ